MTYRSNKIQDISDKTKNFSIKLIRAGKSLRMHNHNNPLSIADVEFDFIYNFVKRHKLKNGYEIATAFGVSMLAPALAMKEHGGHLVTMDAYIEEQYNDCSGYVGKIGTYSDSDGFKSAQHLIKTYGLENVVTPIVGFSPNDTKSALERAFDLNKQKLDYVFIDGLHTDDAVIKDLGSIMPYLNKNRYVVFFHDTHCFSQRVKNHVKLQLGSFWKIAENCTHPGNGYNLAYVTNLE